MNPDQKVTTKIENQKEKQCTYALKYLNCRYDLIMNDLPNENAPCPWCGGEVIRRETARRWRVWCSDQCRRRAYEHRRATNAGGVPKAEVHVVRLPPLEPRIVWTELISQVLNSRTGVRKVLKELERQLDNGEPFEHYAPMRETVEAFHRRFPTR